MGLKHKYSRFFCHYFSTIFPTTLVDAQHLLQLFLSTDMILMIESFVIMELCIEYFLGYSKIL